MLKIFSRQRDSLYNRHSTYFRYGTQEEVIPFARSKSVLIFEKVE